MVDVAIDVAVDVAVDVALDAALTAALTTLAREDGGRVLALLARRYGSLDVAEEAVQDALVEAARTWPRDGRPANPPAWLLAVARRKAIDRLRRSGSATRRTLAAAPELIAIDADIVTDPNLMMIDNDPHAAPVDERLRLLLLCCHPALAPDAQVALTLRLVGGLTTDEIAAAFLVPEATLAQRIVRAKRKIRVAGIPLSMPARFDERVDAVLGVLYLIFNEGYLARGAATTGMRLDLADEAIRLTRVVVALSPEHVDAAGLLALMLFHHARRSTRVDALGELVLLDRQDRSRWDLAMIDEANGVLAAAMAAMHPGTYQLQAIIAAHHANARTAGDTDWPAIARLYGQLEQMTRSPVVAVNHAVAIAMADGPLAGLQALARLDGVDAYHLFHAARGELLLRAGDPGSAVDAFGSAIELTTNPLELRHLRRRIEHAEQVAGA